MKKRVLILGGSKAQESMIMEAKKMALEVVCADMYDDAYCRNIADYFENVSTLDVNNLDKIITKYDVKGISTCSSDRPIPVIAMLSEKHGFSTIGYSAALTSTNKAMMRKSLSMINIPMPNFDVINNVHQLKSITKKYTLPFILKPCDNSGSRGVVLVRNKEDIESQYIYTRQYANSNEILIEEFINGDEISVESFVMNGKNEIIQITDKITTGAPHFVEMGHTQPSKFKKSMQNQLNEIMQNIVDAIGINQGPTHAEFVIRDEIPYLIEIGARLGGDNITTSLVPLSTGINMVKLTLERLFSRNVEVKKFFERGSAIRFLDFDLAKKINKCIIAKLNQIDGFEDLYIEKSNLSIAKELTNSSMRCGYIIASGDNRELALENMEKIIKCIIGGNYR